MSSDHDDERDGGTRSIQPLSPADPPRIGPYALLGRLGAGGMGRVYLARSGGGRTVAVKVVHEEHASNREFRARFRREIAAARRVGDRYTAPVLDADPDAGQPWVATGYVPGPSLGQALREYGPLPTASVHVLADGLLRALQVIHGAGIVHRDLKPSNVLLTVKGPRVIDFGIARALQRSAESLLTSTGRVIGSPGFMAPEQIIGEEIGPTADVFALGCVLMYAATGRLPFGRDASNQHALMYRAVESEPDLTPIEDPPLRALIARCLTKTPTERTGVDALLADPERARPSEAAKRAWLPPGLVARLAQDAARLLDSEAPSTAEPAPAPAPGSAAPAAPAGPDASAVGAPPQSAPSGKSRAPTPERAAPEPAPQPERKPAPAAKTPPSAPAGATTAPGPTRVSRRRTWGVGIVAVVVAVTGSTVPLLDRDGGRRGAAPGDHHTAAPRPANSAPHHTPSPSKDPGDTGRHQGKEGDRRQGGDAREAGPGPSSSGGDRDHGSSGGASTSDGSGTPGNITRSTPGTGSDTGSSGGTGPGSPGPGSPGSGTSDNRVPARFVGTWSLTSPYAPQPQKVTIDRAAPGRHAVTLISDSGGAHCEQVAELVAVTDSGARIDIGTAEVEEARSSPAVCADSAPSSFVLDGSSGIRHDVGPAHGDGYHYERVE
ncbi:protein kinase [Streptomyces sp. NA02950]|uniref:serine/threonine-protein kinase n=1 Tax=Streptomyces sp. NA02950 TaxID=2742137 RepID=UPI00158FCE9D|nr:serine/threonine-protein kinase [Streptomyces sp. NA02950]QKV91805.1 protein kinase [Streptomyces sp. NA02950]